MKLITLIYVLLLFIIFVPNFLLKFPKIKLPFLNLLCSILFSIIFYITFDLVNQTYLKEGHQDPTITINNNRSVGMDKDSTVLYYKNIINGLVENQDDLIGQEQAKMESLKQEKEQQMADINAEIQEIEQEKQANQDASATALLEEKTKCLNAKTELIEKHDEDMASINTANKNIVVGLQQNITALTGEKTKCLNAKTELIEKHDEDMASINTANKNITALTEEKTTLQTNYDTLQTDNTTLQQNITALTEDNTTLQTNYDTLQDAYNNDTCAGRDDLYKKEIVSWSWGRYNSSYTKYKKVTC